MPRRLGAEFFGTFWLTFAGCGSAVLAAGFPTLGIGFLGVSFAFGLTVLTMAYAVGHVSGGHFNCAVTVGLWAPAAASRRRTSSPTSSRRWPARSWQRQCSISSRPASRAGSPGDSRRTDSAISAPANTACCRASSPKCSRPSSFFLYVIIGTTSKGAAVGFAGIPIGLCLTLIHLFLIPVTNASVNPARSTGPALFAGGPYIAQLWLFWLAPMLGAALAGVVARWQHEADQK
jgi:aquaporin Z